MRSCAVVFFIALFFTTSPAWADSVAPPAQGKSTPSCGTTIDDNLAAARRALHTNDGSANAALFCLIEATTALNEHVSALDEARSSPAVRHALDMNKPVAASHQ
jgi:hypothetical protein